MIEIPTRALLVPELIVEDLSASLRFWCDLAGFVAEYDRPETGFAFLTREGVSFMLEQRSAADRTWETAALQRPYGRGVNFQITVAAIEPILVAMRHADWPLFLDSEEKWYRVRGRETGVRQFLVQDPDGYLLRFSELLGWRDHSDSK